MQPAPRSRRTQLGLAACLLSACTALTGCQVDVAGQSLPSPWYQTDDVQVYAAGPEFKLSNEAAALKAQSEARRSETQR